MQEEMKKRLSADAGQPPYNYIEALSTPTLYLPLMYLKIGLAAQLNMIKLNHNNMFIE